MENLDTLRNQTAKSILQSIQVICDIISDNKKGKTWDGFQNMGIAVESLAKGFGQIQADRDFIDHEK